MKVSYSPQWQYTFIKIFYETQEEEKLALELTLGVKSIIDKYGKTKLEKQYVYYRVRNQKDIGNQHFQNCITNNPDGFFLAAFKRGTCQEKPEYFIRTL